MTYTLTQHAGLITAVETGIKCRNNAIVMSEYFFAILQEKNQVVCNKETFNERYSFISDGLFTE